MPPPDKNDERRPGQGGVPAHSDGARVGDHGTTSADVTIGAHPAAEAWPRLSDDELRELADSIAQVGLLHPIVLAPDGAVLDGRNRLAACELAEVEPSFVEHDGDPVAYVLAANEHRRHMTKGQRAMAAWITGSLNNSNGREIAETVGVDNSMMTWAKTVAEHAPDLVASVTDGSYPLKDAYDEARRRRVRPSDLTREEADRLMDDLREEEQGIDSARAGMASTLRRIHSNRSFEKRGYTDFADYVEQRFGIEVDDLSWILDGAG